MNATLTYRATTWRRSATAWLPLAALPMTAAFVFRDQAGWMLMWAVALGLFAAMKWRTLVDCPAAGTASTRRRLGYLLLWSGMDARAFFAAGANPPSRHGQCGVDQPVDATRSVVSPGETWAAVTSLGTGVVLMSLAALEAVRWPPVAVAALGAAGVVLTLHFGLFHLLSILWRRAGIDAPPIMHAPLRTARLAEFWSRRWNLAFSDLARAYLFRPLAGTWGAATALFAVFLVSGLIHELVISLPARGGWGGPTLYFLIQATGCLVQRSDHWRRLAKRHAVIGRLVTACWLVAPLPLLLHGPFRNRVLVPMFAELGGLRIELPVTLATLIWVGGVLHLGILIAGALVPRVLDWKNELGRLDKLCRQLIWVHAVFIVLVIVGFGAVSVLLPAELASGTPLARGVCGFISLFWLARLAVQFFVFDARTYLRTPFLTLGYHGLTVVFTYHAIIYAAAAIG